MKMTVVSGVFQMVGPAWQNPHEPVSNRAKNRGRVHAACFRSTKRRQYGYSNVFGGVGNLSADKGMLPKSAQGFRNNKEGIPHVRLLWTQHLLYHDPKAV